LTQTTELRFGKPGWQGATDVSSVKSMTDTDATMLEVKLGASEPLKLPPSRPALCKHEPWAPALIRSNFEAAVEKTVGAYPNLTCSARSPDSSSNICIIT